MIRQAPLHIEGIYGIIILLNIAFTKKASDLYFFDTIAMKVNF